jgi:hypothetical protein
LKKIAAILISMGMLSAGVAEARRTTKKPGQVKLSKKPKKAVKKVRGGEDGLDDLPARGPERIQELKRRQAAKRGAKAAKYNIGCVHGGRCGGIRIEAAGTKGGPLGLNSRSDGLEQVGPKRSKRKKKIRRVLPRR